jgi:hypothetical protein
MFYQMAYGAFDKLNRCISTIYKPCIRIGNNAVCDTLLKIV